MYTDPDGEWIVIDDLIAAGIGGLINLGVNIINGNLSGMGFWETLGKGAAAFGAGATSGTLALYGPVGWAAGGAIVGGTNAWLGGATGWDIAKGAGLGIVSGLAGGAVGQWAVQNLGGIVINGFNVASPVLKGVITGAIGGGAGGYAGGFTVALLMTGDMSMAHQAGMQGMKFGAGIGAGTGFAGSLYSAKREGLNPFTGKPKNSFTIGEGMITDPTKGWMGVDKIAGDLGSDYYRPDSDIPMNGPFNGSTTSNGMYDNAIWIENNVKGTGAYIYDRGTVGNNSQYYNMEVGRTMDYPVLRVTPYYNRSQSIRILIIRK